jgi:hypothetical protein
LLPRLDGQLKRPWLRLVCFATWLVNDFECNYSIYVGIIIILVEREWSDKFIISSWRTKVLANKIFDISLEIQDELGKDNTSRNNFVQNKSFYILYRRVFASVQHTFLTCVVYTSLISRNVRSIKRYSQIKIVIRIYLLILNTTYINQTLKRFCFVQLFIKLCLKVINITGYVLLNEVWTTKTE